MHYQLARLKYFVSVHRYTIAVLLFIVVVWGGSFATFSYNVYQSIERNEVAAREKEREANRLLGELHDKRAAEAKAKAEAEAKKREEEKRRPRRKVTKRAEAQFSRRNRPKDRELPATRHERILIQAPLMYLSTRSTV